MLIPAKVNELVEYWLLTADESRKTMAALYKSKRYPDCLFFGHLVLEKALKALVVQQTKGNAPYKHNLVVLADAAKIDLEKGEVEFLSEVNEFNMAGRYPDQKLRFYDICTKAYADEYYQQIVTLYRKLCRLARQKKS